MISVGVDVSKGKSTVCCMKDYGEIIAGPMEISHVDPEMRVFAKMLAGFREEVRVVMEATGTYHLPIMSYLLERGFFVSVINPYQMKQYRTEGQGLRKVKTDKADSMLIAKYGIDHWASLKKKSKTDDMYEELSVLSRQYRHYMRVHVESLLELTHILDYTMPGLKEQLSSWNPDSGKDKLSDFVMQLYITGESFAICYADDNTVDGILDKSKHRMIINQNGTERRGEYSVADDMLILIWDDTNEINRYTKMIGL